LEATAEHVMLASGPLRILAVYLSPFWPLINLQMSACLGGGIPALMVEDLNTKHMDLADHKGQAPALLHQ